MGYNDKGGMLSHLNWSLLALAFLLFALGVFNLYSASSSRLESGLAVDLYYKKQLIWGFLGSIGMLTLLIVNYRHLHSLAWPLFILTLILLLCVPFLGKTILGARRWLDLGFFNFQPSELAKISTLLIGAKLLCRGQEPLGLKELLVVLGIGMLPAMLVILQPDLGSGLSILLILGGMILYRGIKQSVLKGLLIVCPLTLPWTWFLLRDYQKARILTFLDPGKDPLNTGWQVNQSQIAIGSGQMWGKGFLEGSQTKLGFLPETHTDFAIAVWGEEWGFWGCVILLSLLCLFLYQIYVSAAQAKDRFGNYLAVGVFFYFFWQICINMGMVLGLLPVVGMPLPFLSYGGSALVVNLSLLGVVLNVSMRRFMFKRD